MKKILLGLVAASCLTSFAMPAFAEDAPKAEGEKTEKKAKKSKKAKKAEKADAPAGDAK